MVRGILGQAGHWIRTNVLPGVLISVLVVALLIGAGEVYLRSTRPFVKPTWVSRFDPVLGFVFEPGATIRQTNHLDFWVESKANRLGFLDREPPEPGSHHTCRIAFVGDSFVEAVQVPIEQKVHVRLEQIWNSGSVARRLETMAFGYSGTGQANQLPWFDLIAPYQPDLVVLVFVANDFANNHAWLEAARNGWHPEHPPRPFLVKDMGGRYTYRPPDPDWRQHLLPVHVTNTHTFGVRPGAGRRSRFGAWLHERFDGKSYLYTSLYRLWQLRRSTPRSLQGSIPDTVRVLRTLPEEGGRFGDWAPPNDLGIDDMFYAASMPPVFHEALANTEEALRQWKQRAEGSGARLVILASHGVETPFWSPEPAAAMRRHYDPTRQIRRLRAMADRLDIPVISQVDYIRRVGGSVARASFAHDGHWSPYGHEMAARAMAEWLTAHPEVCEGRK